MNDSKVGLGYVDGWMDWKVGYWGWRRISQGQSGGTGQGQRDVWRAPKWPIMVITGSIMIQMVIVSLLLPYISDHDKGQHATELPLKILTLSAPVSRRALIMPPVKTRLKAIRKLNAMLRVIMTEDGEQMCI